jgi:hypothetical protein
VEPGVTLRLSDSYQQRSVARVQDQGSGSVISVQ